MGLSLDKRKNCVAEASEVLQDIAKEGKRKNAQAKLKSVEKDVVGLAFQAEMLAKRLEAVDKMQQERDAEMLRQFGELSRHAGRATTSSEESCC